jgi:hypothetical protein
VVPVPPAQGILGGESGASDGAGSVFTTLGGGSVAARSTTGSASISGAEASKEVVGSGPFPEERPNLSLILVSPPFLTAK